MIKANWKAKKEVIVPKQLQEDLYPSLIQLLLFSGQTSPEDVAEASWDIHAHSLSGL